MIVFSYFMELEVPIKPDLAATLLYGIESDLAGAAGSPGELDNIALSSLTLIANREALSDALRRSATQLLHCLCQRVSNAVVYDNVLISHLDSIGSLEIPAVLADFLLRLDKVDATMVTAVHDSRLIVSLRTNNAKLSAADVARRLVRNIGVGGGHRAKAGGYINLETGSPTEVDKIRGLLRKRFCACSTSTPIGDKDWCRGRMRRSDAAGRRRLISRNNNTSHCARTVAGRIRGGMKLCPGVSAANIASPVTPGQSVLAPSRILPARGFDARFVAWSFALGVVIRISKPVLPPPL